MCGRSSLHDAPVNVLERFRLPPVLPGFTPRYNIAPSQEQWTILARDNGAPQAKQLKWGLVPSWAQDPNVGQRMINARSDSIADKPSYQDSFRSRRCLVLADGYYEWAKEGKSRIPIFFRLSGDRAFAIAGLWDRWEKGETPLDTCIVITTDAAPKAAAVHHRMPAILDLDHAAEWLDPLTKEKRLLDLLVPYEKPDLECYEVSSFVNAPANDSEDCIAAHERPPVIEELTLWDM